MSKLPTLPATSFLRDVSALEHFDRVRIISLPEREERRQRLANELHGVFPGYADHPDFGTTRAINGHDSPPPEWWYRNDPRRQGHGAWGCLHSHTRIVHEAQHVNAARRGSNSGLPIDSLLILEDDVIFQPDAAPRLDRFMQLVPADWDMIYLGGQHQKRPLVTEIPGVLRCVEVHRTHAYAIREKFFKTYLEHIWHAPDYMARKQSHIDHQLGLLHARMQHNIYCPDWHLAGQDAAPSDISGEDEQERWWHPPQHIPELTCVHVPADIPPGVYPILQEHLHFGNHLQPSTLTDKGIDEHLRKGTLEKFCAMIADEALGLQKHWGICHPAVSIEMLQPFLGKLAREILPESETYLGALRSIPF